ncbi:MAG: GTPase Era [Alphaproteobacteria bacterium]|nr:GTPase Era [Alphaproteobacteria bacterium]
MTTSVTDQHFAFVAILGASNSGKSTLMNKILGDKVSIVSPKVQTTRSRIRGVFVQDNTQLVLVDTPGIFKPSRRLDRAMVASAWTEADEADKLLVLIDATKGIDKNTEKIIQTLTQNKQKAILAVNKIDLVKPEKLMPLAKTLGTMPVWQEIFYISAKTGKNVQDLVSYLVKNTPRTPWMFSDSDITDMPDRLFAAEVTREKLFMNLQDELPYHLAVETTLFKELSNSIRIEQNIIVERIAHRMIILGKNGSMIKKIGEQSRKELTRLFDKKVNLFLFVKVKENWGDDPNQYTPWGLDFNA